MAQVAAALDAAHEAGLVHRDVKPGNILVVPGVAGQHRDHVYLSDFGLTKRVTSLSGVTAQGQFIATMDYAAPEQIGSRPVDARTDVYGLGCVAYQCLTGTVPFVRDNEAALLWAHLVERPPPVSAHRSELAPFDAAIARALEKNPEDRFASCGQFVDALAAALPTATATPAATPAAGLSAALDIPTQAAGSAAAQDTPTQATPAPHTLTSLRPASTAEPPAGQALPNTPPPPPAARRSPPPPAPARSTEPPAPPTPPHPAASPTHRAARTARACSRQACVRHGGRSRPAAPPGRRRRPATGTAAVFPVGGPGRRPRGVGRAYLLPGRGAHPGHDQRRH